MKMCDMHMHLVPGVDDGAVNAAMACDMAAMALEQGIFCICATPHSSAFAYDAEETLRRFEKIKGELACKFPELEIYLGCEVFCEEWDMDRVLGRLSSGQFPSIHGTRYVLVEFDPGVDSREVRVCAEKLGENGWIPVIAHMERYPRLQQNRMLVSSLREMGCLIQVNAYSLQEEKDPAIREWARFLVADGLADLLGTDAHRTGHRPPRAAAGIRWLYEACEKTHAEQIAWRNAVRILAEGT